MRCAFCEASAPRAGSRRARRQWRRCLAAIDTSSRGTDGGRSWPAKHGELNAFQLRIHAHSEWSYRIAAHCTRAGSEGIADRTWRIHRVDRKAVLEARMRAQTDDSDLPPVLRHRMLVVDRTGVRTRTQAGIERHDPRPRSAARRQHQSRSDEEPNARDHSTDCIWPERNRAPAPNRLGRTLPPCGRLHIHGCRMALISLSGLTTTS